MAVPAIAIAAAAFVENAPAIIAGISAMSLSTLIKNKEYIKDSFYQVYYNQLLAIGDGSGASLDNSSTIPVSNSVIQTQKKYEDLDYFTKQSVDSVIDRIKSTGRMSNEDAKFLSEHGITMEIKNVSSDTSTSLNNSNVANLISSLQKENDILRNDIASLNNAISAMNEYYASYDILNDAVANLQKQISDLKVAGNSNTGAISKGGLIGAISASTAKLDAISNGLVSLNSSTQMIASKTGNFNGSLKITNAKDIAPNVSVSSPEVSVNPVFSPEFSATIDISKPMTINGLSELISTQNSIKSIEDERALREKEAHDILKEKTDFLTKPRVIRDMDGNDLINVAPREIALTHQASLARTYTDENTTTLNDLDFDSGIDFMNIFNGFKVGLVSDIPDVPD